MAIIKKKNVPYRKRQIDITGPQGNAYCLLGIAEDLAKQLKKNKAAILDEMTSGDYENLLKVFDREFGAVVDLIR